MTVRPAALAVLLPAVVALSGFGGQEGSVAQLPDGAGQPEFSPEASRLRARVEKAATECDVSPAEDCFGNSSAACGLYVFDVKNPDTMLSQCPNMRGFELDGQGDVFPYRSPSCCRGTPLTEEAVDTELSTVEWVERLMAAVPSEHHKHQSRPTPLAVTIVGDSTMTNLWQNLKIWLENSTDTNNPYEAVEQGMVVDPDTGEGVEHSDWLSQTSPQALESWPGERPCGLGRLNASQPWDTGVHQMNYGPHSNEFVRRGTNRSVYLQYFPLNSLLATVQDYRTLGAPTGWHKRADEKWRLGCAGEVLRHVANFSDVIIFNEGAHYQHEERQLMRRSLAFALGALADLVEDEASRLKLLLGMESVPTHFATRDGSGLYGHTRPQPQGNFASKLHADCVFTAVVDGGGVVADDEKGMTAMRPEPYPPGLRPFPCVPIANETLARWRNDVLNEEAAKRQIPVIKRFELLKDRCDLHQRLHDDCLHFDYGKAGAYMRNGMAKAMCGAIAEATGGSMLGRHSPGTVV
jgi:hypothetical protein